MVVDLFGVNNAMISLFSYFKVIKVKKATSVAGKAKLQMRTFIEPKILLEHTEELL